jgi:small subunit ribosomal protein S4
MGSPKRNRKKLQRPAAMWNKQRIEEEHRLRDAYGLKKLEELWKATSEIRRIKRNVRQVLSGREGENVGREIIARLARYNVINSNAVLDDLLLLKPESLLERRLETIVYRRGLAKSFGQARQLITHGFIAINGRRITSPGYLVRSVEEGSISYYKKIDIDAGVKGNVIGAAPGAQPAQPSEAPQQQEAPVQREGVGE